MNTKKLFGTGVTAMLLVGLLAIAPAVGAEESEPADETAMGMLYEVVLATEEATYPIGEIVTDLGFDPAPVKIPELGEIHFSPKTRVEVGAGDILIVVVEHKWVDTNYLFAAGIHYEDCLIGPYIIVAYHHWIWVGVNYCPGQIIREVVRQQPPSPQGLL
ncbi:MAG: hypothetical protein OIN87_02200 [Candidatus Methanoperedens sp.]|nr:hypothetical protein [Candidatus Methanoperedens sp.]